MRVAHFHGQLVPSSAQERRVFPMDSDLLTIEEAAEALNTKVRHMRSLTYRNEIPYVKLGHLVRYERDALRSYVEQQRVPAAP